VFAVVAALLAALMYGMASVLQQRGAAAQPADQALKLGLLVRLIRNPGWVLGLVCDVLGFVFQVVALRHGPLVVVQPLLVCGLLVAIPVGTAWSGRRLGRLGWVGALMVVAGLALFLTIASPGDGTPTAGWHVWLLLLGTDALFALALIGLSSNRSQRTRALLLSGAAGVIYGAGAALAKTTSYLFGSGPAHLLTHWEPYALVVFGIAGMVVGQSAFQAGALDISLPTMTVADPLVSIVIGAFAFGESLSSGAPEVLLEVVGLVVMTTGVFFLARRGAVEEVAVERPVGV
jgi:drug/metabolite transporter (DMT)-like permease